MQRINVIWLILLVNDISSSSDKVVFELKLVNFSMNFEYKIDDN